MIFRTKLERFCVTVANRLGISFVGSADGGSPQGHVFFQFFNPRRKVFAMGKMAHTGHGMHDEYSGALSDGDDGVVELCRHLVVQALRLSDDERMRVSSVDKEAVLELMRSCDEATAPKSAGTLDRLGPAPESAAAEPKDPIQEARERIAARGFAHDPRLVKNRRR